MEAANEAMAMAIKVCIRTGARYFSEYAHLTKKHVKDNGDRMEWVFQPHESKNGKLRVLRITDQEIIRIARDQIENGLKDQSSARPMEIRGRQTTSVAASGNWSSELKGR